MGAAENQICLYGLTFSCGARSIPHDAAGYNFMMIIQPEEFAIKMKEVLFWYFGQGNDNPGAVTGPGRSGAIASVYASHMLGIPFIPYGNHCPDHLAPLLVIDTAKMSGASLRKACRKYAHLNPISIHLYDEPPRVRFWYEKL